MTSQLGKSEGEAWKRSCLNLKYKNLPSSVEIVGMPGREKERVQIYECMKVHDIFGERQ